MDMGHVEKRRVGYLVPPEDAPLSVRYGACQGKTGKSLKSIIS